MKKLMSLLVCLSTLAACTTMAAPADSVMTIYTTASWSNMFIVHPNNPGIICYQSGHLNPGASITITEEDITKNLEKCYYNKTIGVIFFGNSSKAPFPPQYIKHGEKCTASWKIIGNKLVFDCVDMS